jgi:hypothetical protein
VHAFAVANEAKPCRILATCPTVATPH